jgi:hypothetical protein
MVDFMKAVTNYLSISMEEIDTVKIDNNLIADVISYYNHMGKLIVNLPIVKN